PPTDSPATFEEHFGSYPLSPKMRIDFTFFAIPGIFGVFAHRRGGFSSQSAFRDFVVDVGRLLGKMRSNCLGMWVAHGLKP
ncbi:MAG: hypothetical protein ACR2IT_01750, partial [Pirellulales bacterium]